MKCLGALDRFVLRLFLLEASMQGLVGAGLGALAGALFALLSNAARFGTLAVTTPVPGDILLSVAIGLTLLIMVPIVWVYRASQVEVNSNKKDGTVLETLVVLPVIITGIVLIIQNSIALAFGLAGIVAGVQYRNRLALSVDAAYLFAAIAIGLASGIEAVGIGMMTGLWFCLTLIVTRILGLSEPAASQQD
mgnify:CR=1 FL=1